MASFTAAIYAAHVLGVPLGPAQLVTGGIIAIVMVAAGVGMPGEITFFAIYVPIFNSMGVPIEILALMVAVNAIPGHVPHGRQRHHGHGRDDARRPSRGPNRCCGNAGAAGGRRRIASGGGRLADLFDDLALELADLWARACPRWS